jgi:hypothetical protein
LVAQLEYKPGWTVTLEDLERGQGSRGLTLCILIRCADTYEPDKIRPVMHCMPVPPAAFNEHSWRRWLFDQILKVEQHEAAEWFKIAGSRPYAPLHSPGNNPYTIVELATDEERRSDFRGQLQQGAP